MQVAGEAELKDHRIPLEKGRERGWGRVSIPADANPADNDYWFVFEQPAPQAVDHRGRRPAGRRGRFRLAASISPDPALQCTAEVVAQSQVAAIDWDQVSLLLWQAALPELESAKQIRSFVERGGSAIFFPPRSPAAARSSACGSPPGPRTKPIFRWSAGGATRTCSPIPRAGRRCRWGRSRCASTAGFPGDVTALATLRDGPPLAGEGHDRPRVGLLLRDDAGAGGFIAGDERRGVLRAGSAGPGLGRGGAREHAAARWPATGARETTPTLWKRVSGAEEALSTDYAFHSGIYRSRRAAAGGEPCAGGGAGTGGGRHQGGRAVSRA